MGKFTAAAGWLLGTAVSDGGKDAFVQSVQLTDGTGTATGTAVSPQVVKSAGYTYRGQEQILDATLAASTALTVPALATVAIVQHNGTTSAVRYRYDGATTPPTTTTGQRIASGAVVTMDVGNATLTAVRLIREAALTGNIDITYFS